MLTIQSKTQTTVILLASSPLKAGTLVEFLPSGVRASVGRYLGQRTYEVKVAIGNDDAVRLADWWRLKQPESFKLMAPLQFFESGNGATLDITTNVLPTNHIAGSLGWDLWYRPDNLHPWFEVAAGNDLEVRGKAIGKIDDAAWPAGLWLFKATAFYKTNLVPVSNAQFSWELKEVTETILKTYELQLGA
jgi:hypothetical protein